jgi:hypothetical protein
VDIYGGASVYVLKRALLMLRIYRGIDCE